MSLSRVRYRKSPPLLHPLRSNVIHHNMSKCLDSPKSNVKINTVARPKGSLGSLRQKPVICNLSLNPLPYPPGPVRVVSSRVSCTVQLCYVVLFEKGYKYSSFRLRKSVLTRQVDWPPELLHGACRYSRWILSFNPFPTRISVTLPSPLRFYCRPIY